MPRFGAPSRQYLGLSRAFRRSDGHRCTAPARASRLHCRPAQRGGGFVRCANDLLHRRRQQTGVVDLYGESRRVHLGGRRVRSLRQRDPARAAFLARQPHRARADRRRDHLGQRPGGLYPHAGAVAQARAGAGRGLPPQSRRRLCRGRDLFPDAAGSPADRAELGHRSGRIPRQPRAPEEQSRRFRRGRAAVRRSAQGRIGRSDQRGG